MIFLYKKKRRINVSIYFTLELMTKIESKESEKRPYQKTPCYGLVAMA